MFTIVYSYFRLNKNIIVKIIYDDEYPFLSPTIYINKCKYYTLLKKKY